MARVFISYSRRDTDFVRKLNDALVAHNREAWVDWKDIPLTAEWQQEIFTNIEAADNFIFIISPDSVSSPNCRKEIDHAVSNNKRMVPIFRRPVPDNEIPASLGRFQRIAFTNEEEFDPKFAALISALDSDLAWVQVHTRLLTRAKEWEREGKDNSFLLHGKDLREAERWVVKGAEKEPKLTTLHSQYILASRQSATRLQRIVIGAVIVAFLIAVGLAVYSFIQKNLAERETKIADANATEASRQKQAANEQKDIAVQNEKEAKRQEGIAKKETAAAERNARESKARELMAFAAMSQSDDPAAALFLGWQSAQVSRPLAPGLERVLDEALFTGNLATLRGHQEKLISVAWRPDGKSVASIDDGGVVKIWDASGQEVRTFSVNFDSVHSIAWSPDGKSIAVAGKADEDDSFDKIMLRDMATGEALQTLSGRQYTAVPSMAWSPDGKSLVFASGSQVKVSDVNTGKDLRILGCNDERVMSVAWSPDGKFLAGACSERGKDSLVEIWEASTGQKLRSFGGGGNKLLSSVAWSSDSKSLAAVGDSDVRMWDVATGGGLRTLDTHSRSAVWSPDSKSVATVDNDQTLRLWAVETGVAFRTFHGDPDNMTSVAWSPGGEYLASGSEDNTVRLWGVEAGQELRVFRIRGRHHEVTSVAWSPDGRYLVSASTGSFASFEYGKQQEVELWDAGTGQELRAFNGLGVTSVVWNPDGVSLAGASSDEDGSAVKVWDASTGQQVRFFHGHQKAVTSVAWSPNGKFLASASLDGTAKLWDASTGQELHTLGGHQGEMRSVAWSPNGKFLATVSSASIVKIWNAGTGQELRTLGGHQDRVETVAWSPDGRYLVGGYFAYSPGHDDYALKLWDTNSGQQVRVFRGHQKTVTSVAWSPNGKFLASASWDDTVRLWDASTGQELRTFRGHQGIVWSVKWSPDGRSLVSAGGDGTLRIYPVTPDLLLSVVRSRIRQLTLSKPDCERYFGSPICPIVK